MSNAGVIKIVESMPDATAWRRSERQFRRIDHEQERYSFTTWDRETIDRIRVVIGDSMPALEASGMDQEIDRAQWDYQFTGSLLGYLEQRRSISRKQIDVYLRMIINYLGLDLGYPEVLDSVSRLALAEQGEEPRYDQWGRAIRKRQTANRERPKRELNEQSKALLERLRARS